MSREVDIVRDLAVIILTDNSAANDMAEVPERFEDVRFPSEASRFEERLKRKAHQLARLTEADVDRYRREVTRKWHDRFPSHAVFAVVHVSSQRQALRNLAIVRAAKAAGAFLIQHGAPSVDLADVRSKFGDSLWIGANHLCRDTAASLSSLEAFDGIWADNGNATSFTRLMVDYLVRIDLPTDRFYFGGVAFKYQQPVPDAQLSRVVQRASRYIDVVTTSGDGTGSAPAVDKISKISFSMEGDLHADGTAPLAIASGVSIDNVDDFMPYADTFLVASSVSREFDELDLNKLGQLVDRVRTYYDRQIGKA